MSFTWTVDHKMTPAEAVTHLRRSLVGIDWQAVQALAGEVELVRAELLDERREHLRTIDDALALAAEWETTGGLAGAAAAARLRETLGEKP